jgi:hypothetical protein
MIQAIWDYFRKEVGPRWRQLLLTSEALIAIVAGWLFSWLGPSSLGSKPLLNEFVTATAAYDAIALGFCVAGMTIALTLPNPELMRRMAKKEIKGLHGNALSGLLFVFSWTAFMHWIAIVLLLVALVFGGSDKGLLAADASALRRWLIGGLISFNLYCLLQFLITVVTLSQVGNVYIDDLRKPAELDANSLKK